MVGSLAVQCYFYANLNIWPNCSLRPLVAASGSSQTGEQEHPNLSTLSYS